MNNSTQAYFYLPPELFSEEYVEYSAESKLLFSMLLTNMTTASGVLETARLIDDIGVRKISAMHKVIESEIKMSKESEGM